MDNTAQHIEWTEIEDGDVLHEWKSENSGEIITVTPDFYQDNGTPIDDEGDDMIYVRTLIRKKISG